jgi:hypothetical protein
MDVHKMLSKSALALIVSLMATLVFSVVCLDTHQKNILSHIESVLAGCIKDVGTMSCTATHQFLSNVVIVGTLFVFMLLLLIGGTSVLIHIRGKSKIIFFSRYIFFIRFLVSIPTYRSYLLQAFSSGLLHPRLYN